MWKIPIHKNKKQEYIGTDINACMIYLTENES